MAKKKRTQPERIIIPNRIGWRRKIDEIARNVVDGDTILVQNTEQYNYVKQRIAYEGNNNVGYFLDYINKEHI